MEVLYVFYSVTDGKLNKAFLHFLTIFFFGILPSLKVELIKRHFELVKNQMCQIFVQKLKKCLIKPALKNPIIRLIPGDPENPISGTKSPSLMF